MHTIPYQLNIIFSACIKLVDLFLHKRQSSNLTTWGSILLTMRFFRRSLSRTQLLWLKCEILLTENETLATVRPIFSFVKFRVVVFHHLQQIVISSKNKISFKSLRDNCCVLAPCTAEISDVKIKYELAGNDDQNYRT